MLEEDWAREREKKAGIVCYSWSISKSWIPFAINPVCVAVRVTDAVDTFQVEAPLGLDDTQYVSFNPRSKKQFVLGNQRSLSIWVVNTKFEQFSLIKTYGCHGASQACLSCD
jgi:hypothetical protein